MAMILNRTTGMLSVRLDGKMFNFVPGIATRISRDEEAALMHNRSFKMWCEKDNIVTGKQARKEDLSEEVAVAEENDKKEREKQLGEEKKEENK